MIRFSEENDVLDVHVFMGMVAKHFNVWLKIQER